MYTLGGTTSPLVRSSNPLKWEFSLIHEAPKISLSMMLHVLAQHLLLFSDIFWKTLPIYMEHSNGSLRAEENVLITLWVNVSHNLLCCSTSSPLYCHAPTSDANAVRMVDRSPGSTKLRQMDMPSVLATRTELWPHIKMKPIFKETQGCN